MIALMIHNQKIGELFGTVPRASLFFGRDRSGFLSSPLLCPDKGTIPSTEEDRATTRTYRFCHHFSYAAHDVDGFSIIENQKKGRS